MAKHFNNLLFCLAKYPDKIGFNISGPNMRLNWEINDQMSPVRDTTFDKMGEGVGGEMTGSELI